jgi:hypothetical protein
MRGANRAVYDAPEPTQARCARTTQRGLSQLIWPPINFTLIFYKYMFDFT